MNRSLLKLSPWIFAAALLCMLLPFVTISCQGQPLVKMSGVELATGTDITEPGMFGGQGPKKHLDGEPLMAVVALAGLAGFGLALRKTPRVALAPAVAGAAGLTLLLILKVRLDGQISQQGKGMLLVEYGMGYWGMALMYGGAALLQFVGWRTQDEESRAPEAFRTPLAVGVGEVAGRPMAETDENGSNITQ